MSQCRNRLAICSTGSNKQTRKNLRNSRSVRIAPSIAADSGKYDEQPGGL
jgi:hypothetical protein